MKDRRCIRTGQTSEGLWGLRGIVWRWREGNDKRHHHVGCKDGCRTEGLLLEYKTL